MIRKFLCWLGFHAWGEPINQCGSWFRICPHCCEAFQIYRRGLRKNEWRECEVIKDSAGRFSVRSTNGNMVFLEKIL
jgi:hypothetical protein